MYLYVNYKQYVLQPQKTVNTNLHLFFQNSHRKKFKNIVQCGTTLISVAKEKTPRQEKTFSYTAFLASVEQATTEDLDNYGSDVSVDCPIDVTANDLYHLISTSIESLHSTKGANVNSFITMEVS